MASEKPQFTLYTHTTGPNGWKVTLILEELGLTYESKYLQFDTKEQKDPKYLEINPNGRVPSLVDHKNNDFKIWESGAIILYLVKKYDPEHKISFDKFEDEIIATQWLIFQVSGQGPYFGQGIWFKLYHFENLPSARKRYQDEIDRVLGVLDGVLKDSKWLVKDKFSYVDLSFFHWNSVVDVAVDDENHIAKDFHNVARWMDAMKARPTVKKIIDEKVKVKPH